MGVLVQYQMQPAANFPEHHRFNIPFVTECNFPHWSCGRGFQPVRKCWVPPTPV
jgi:hypothetical protein